MNELSTLKNIVYSLNNLERKILPYLLNTTNIEIISEKFNIEKEEIQKGILFLESKNLVEICKNEISYIQLDKFGIKFLKSNLPEILLIENLENSKKKISEISLDKETIFSAIGILKRNNIIKIEKNDSLLTLSLNPNYKIFKNKNKINPLIEFENKIEKEKLTQKQKEIFETFKQRKGFLKEKIVKNQDIILTSIGKEIAILIKEKYSNIELTEVLTNEMLKEKSWENKIFRHYDLNVETTMPRIGRNHPMNEVNDILSKIFLEMGFSEMEGPIVESAFWNMDVMWIPQDHPARDEQDTFYLEHTCEVDENLIKKIKKMHEEGIKKTHTEKFEWSEKITKKSLLRTHSTATSFRYLYDLSKKLKEGKDINGKYYYIATVFRNEAIDSTHLAEFFQAEGFIIGDDLSLAHLIGFVKQYLKKLGFNKVKFKPTFNPYTEPSMEAHIYDEKEKKWYSIINSGIFRPETLKPFGLENKTIIAWGFGASRIAAKLTKVQSLRDITGYTCDFQWLKTRPITKHKLGEN